MVARIRTTISINYEVVVVADDYGTTESQFKAGQTPHRWAYLVVNEQ